MAYSVDFKDLKNKVGITDIALSLGYQLDRKAGRGRFVELVLPDGQGGKSDTIIISHPNDKGHQTYFRRSDGRNKDVIGFILEKKGVIGIAGRNDWDIVAKTLAKFANQPLPVNKDAEYISSTGVQAEYDPSKYEVHPVAENLQSAQYIFRQRKITPETVKAFAPWVVRIRSNFGSGNFYNIGFPYTKPGEDKVEGYEIRGVGSFKRKAYGTNSNSAAWIVDFTKNGNPQEVKNVYFAESAFDIMAFYQANRIKPMNGVSPIDWDNSVLVSVGGSLSRNQAKGIMAHYSNARAVDCFDNDVMGRIYGMRLVDAVEGLGLTVTQKDDKIEVGYKGKHHVFDSDTAGINSIRSFAKLKRLYGTSKAPSNFKDWNDVIMDKPLERKMLPTKHDRNESLENRRKGGIKM